MEELQAKLDDYNAKLKDYRAWLENMMASNRAPAPTTTTTTTTTLEEEEKEEKDTFTTLLHDHDTTALTRILQDIQSKMEQDIARRQGSGEKISLVDGKRCLDEFFADVKGEGGKGEKKKRRGGRRMMMSQETLDWLGKYFPRLEETVEGLCWGEGEMKMEKTEMKMEKTEKKMEKMEKKKKKKKKKKIVGSNE